MNLLKTAVLVLLLAAEPAIAQEQPASAASVRELLALTQSRKMIDGVTAQADASMQKSIEQAIAGHQLTPDQQKIVADMRSKIIVLLKDNLKWETLEPTLIDIYEKSFTQKELDGMLSFYKSEAGQAVVTKMPLVLQNTMLAMQSRMTTLTPQIQKIQKDSLAQLQASAPK